MCARKFMADLIQGLSSLPGSRSVGKALLVVGLTVCVYQVWRRWYVKRLVVRRFKDKVVLITGASSGLGEALTRQFYALGSKVIIASRNIQDLQQLKFQLDSEPRSEVNRQITRYSPKVLSLDLSESSSLAEKCEEAISYYGRVDILINNAGIGVRGNVMDTDVSVDRRIMEVNFFGTVALTKGLLPSMLEQGGGAVVVISSLQGKFGLPGRSSYSASKHALQGYFDSLRCELAPRGVAVTVVSPGYIRTQFSVNALSGDGTRHGVMDPTTSRGMAPSQAARSILEGVAEGRREMVLAKPLNHLAVYVRVLWPSLFDWVLRRREI